MPVRTGVSLRYIMLFFFMSMHLYEVILTVCLFADGISVCFVSEVGESWDIT